MAATIYQGNTAYYDHGNQLFGGHSYAQHGDDIIILNIFNRLVMSTPSYIDIGAHHPYLASNTALLYERGSSGVNVEADSSCIAAFQEYRKRDINLNCGVGPARGSFPLYGNHIKSFDPTFAGRYGPLGKGIEVQVYTLSDIVEKHCGGIYPELLTIDAEGFDFAVIETVDYSSANLPLVICIEDDDMGRIRPLLTGNGYFFFCWAGGNMFFIRDELKDQIYGERRTF